MKFANLGILSLVSLLLIGCVTEDGMAIFTEKAQEVSPVETDLQAKVESLEALVATLQSQMQAMQEEQSETPEGMSERLLTLEQKTAAISVSQDALGRDSVYFTGVNVYIQNGEGKTGKKNGLGNLVLGYNELRGQRAYDRWVSSLDDTLAPDFPRKLKKKNKRSGSHNLVIGKKVNYKGVGNVIVGKKKTSKAKFKIQGKWKKVKRVKHIHIYR